MSYRSQLDSIRMTIPESKNTCALSRRNVQSPAEDQSGDVKEMIANLNSFSVTSPEWFVV